jgi:FkbM family methyltransferase
MQVQMGDIAFTVQDDEFGLFWKQVANHAWEPDSFDVLRRLLTPDSTFVDVGAWIGPLTLYGAHLARRCHAIEPDPCARAALTANVALNPDLSDRISVHPAAVAEFEGTAKLGNITSRAGGDSMSSLLFGDAPTSWVVDCITLEGLINRLGIGKVGLVKIDIEGAEVEVLSGSRSYIESAKPPLFLSVHGRFWPDPLPRMQRLLNVLSAYREILTPKFLPVDPQTFLDEDHLGGLFEIVAL